MTDRLRNCWVRVPAAGPALLWEARTQTGFAAQ